MSPAPLLAACCGPVVAVWDCSASSPSSPPAPIDIDSAPVAPASTDDGVVRIFRPHGTSPDAPHVADMAWNHSGQILASCSSSPRAGNDAGPSGADNVVLTHAATGSALESFSNFHPRKPSSSAASSASSSSSDSEAATSIGFGGKSRYICASDRAGWVSIWDMKKRSRVRNYRLPPAPRGGEGGKQTCPAACIDPTDSLVAALSGYPSDGALRLYRLREGKLAATLRDASERGGPHGGAVALHFSPLVREHCAVGTRDGTVLVWDASVASAAAGKGSAGASEHSEPRSSLTGRHSAAVTGVAFSPVNKLLLATSSLDGTVAFHDVNSRKTIQTVRAPQQEGSSSSGSEGGSAAGVGVSCVAFHSDGVTCAAGTEDGAALLYDLRKAGAGPLSTLAFARSSAEAATPPVGAVKFADRTGAGRAGRTPRAERKAEEGGGVAAAEAEAAAAAEAAKEVAHPPAPAAVPAAPTPPPSEASTAPAAEAEVEEEAGAAVPATPQHAEGDAAAAAAGEEGGDEDDGLSPVSRARQLIAHSARKAASLAAPAGVGGGGARARSSAGAGGAPPLPPSRPSATPSAANSSTAAVEAEAGGGETSTVGAAATESSPPPAPAAAAGGSPVGTTSAEEEVAAATPHAAVFGTAAAASMAAAEGLDDYVVVEGGDASFLSPDVRVNKLVLRSMLDDAVDALRDDVEDAVRNLHVDVLRQFQALSDEVRAAAERQNEAVRELLKENRRLREENDSLRGRGRI